MIDVRSSPIHGRGAFATQGLIRGQLFHTAHLLVFDCGQSAAVAKTAAAFYVFHVEDCPCEPEHAVSVHEAPEHAVTGIALSPISFVNHARPCSASFAVDAATRTVSFTALSDIQEGEEITIDYGDFAVKLGIA